MKKVHSCMSLVGFFALGFLSSAQAEVLVFNVVGTSSLTLSGNAAPGGNTFGYQQQAAGTMSTTFLGTITVNVDNVFAPSTIAIQSASLDANLNSVTNIRPLPSGASGFAPADYGVSIPDVGGLGALRDIVFNVSAASTAVTGGSFAVSGQSWSYLTGNFDVSSAALGAGRINLLAGSPSGLNTGAQGSYTVSSNAATLVLPTNVSIQYSDNLTGTNTYTGTITAIAAVPEPSSIALLSVCAIGAAAARLRKRKQLAS